MNSYAEVLDAYDKGRYHIAPYRKVRVTNATTPTDMSYGAGIPIANYYASAPLVQAELLPREGIFHGISSSDKFLHKISINVATPSLGSYILCDYVSYIPFIDGDSTDIQTFETHALPRYADGKGIQLMVISQGIGIATGNMTLTYTNQDGVAGRVATTFVDGTSAVGSQAHPRSNWVQLQAGDSGIRLIESVVFDVSIGGIYSLVLVKPTVSVNVSDITAPMEIDYFSSKMNMPKIHKDAYLNFVFKSLSAVTTNIQAQLEFIY